MKLVVYSPTENIELSTPTLTLPGRLIHTNVKLQTKRSYIQRWEY